MSSFAGRNIIVTGSSRGIGAATAVRLAAEGANLLLVARTLDRHEHLAGSLTETVQHCATHGVTVVPHVADLTDPASRATIVPAALEAFGGRIDVLVNNAAAAIYAPLVDYPMRRLRVSFEANVMANVDLMQQVLPGMLDRGEGWIVNVSSASARLADGPPFPDAAVTGGMGVYGASKAALNKLTNTFAAELYGSGVRINTVQPRAAVMSEGATALVGDRVTPDLMETMEEMVESIVALCECGADTTGGIHVSLDLIESLGREVRALNGGPFDLPAARKALGQ